MHMRGTPETMHRGHSPKMCRDVSAGLRAAVLRARRAGISKSRLVIDPGIGFGKNYAQNFEILARLPNLRALGLPLLVGTSRKAFLSAVTGGAGSAGCATRTAPMGHRSHCGSCNPRRGVHRSSARCRRDGPGGARYRSYRRRPLGLEQMHFE